MKSKIIASVDSPEIKKVMNQFEAGIPSGLELLHNKRNKVALINSNGHRWVYKQFSSALKNKLIYAIFSSKAKRSFYHSLRLESLGIATPRPLAYSEKRNLLHLLIHSAYLCEYEEAISLEEYLRDAKDDRWESFALFVAELHEKGILHKDLNSTNVRVHLSDSSVRFSLIDNNRMAFFEPGKMPLKRALENLTRFSYLTSGFKAFLKTYIAQRNLPDNTYSQALEIKRRHDSHTEKRKSRKKFNLL